MRELAKGALVLVTLAVLRFALWHPGPVEGVTQLDLALAFWSDLTQLRWGEIHLPSGEVPTIDYVGGALLRTFLFLFIVIGAAILVAPWIHGIAQKGGRPSRAVAAAAVIAASVPTFCLFYLLLFPVWAVHLQPWFPTWWEFTVYPTVNVIAVLVLALSGLGAALWHVRANSHLVPNRKCQATGQPRKAASTNSSRLGMHLAPFLRFLQLRLGELLTWVLVVDVVANGGRQAGSALLTPFHPIMFWWDIAPLIWTMFAIAVGMACLYTVIGVALALLDEDPDAARLIPPPAAPPAPP